MRRSDGAKVPVRGCERSGGSEGKGCGDKCARAEREYSDGMVRLVTLVLALFAVAATGRVVAQQQAAPANLDFEAGAPGEMPTGWLMSTTQAQPGIRARIVTDERRSGAQGVVLTREPSAAAGPRRSICFSSSTLRRIADAGSAFGWRSAPRPPRHRHRCGCGLMVPHRQASPLRVSSSITWTTGRSPVRTGVTTRSWLTCHRRRRGSSLASTWSALAGPGSTTGRSRSCRVRTPPLPRRQGRFHDGARQSARLLASARLRPALPSQRRGRSHGLGRLCVAGVRAVESSVDGTVLTQRLADRVQANCAEPLSSSRRARRSHPAQVQRPARNNSSGGIPASA